jgi:bifunctional oligoribonuclease and PAP phosphatase NrnA
MEKIRKQIVDIINRSERILLMPSSPVDGDSLGSALALYLVLKKMGKEATVVCADPVPDAYKFLPTTKVISDDFSASKDFIVTLDCKRAKLKHIKTKLEQDKVNIIITAKKGQFSSSDVSFHHGPHKYDLIITVDTGDLEQLGRFYEDNPEIFVNIPLVNIDHHSSNSNFGKINYIDIMSSSTTELLIPLIEDFEKQTEEKLMDEDVATLLLAGIITDTGSFQNANTTPRSFAASAKLIKYGARQQEIIQHIFKTKNLSTLKLWGRILTKMKVDDKHKMVWSTITNKDFADTGSSDDETGGIIDELMSNAPGTEVVLLLKQKENNLISGSLRTTNPTVDASEMAEMFGGGGHVQAAGFRIESDDMEKTEQMVIEKIRKYQAERLGVTEFDPEVEVMTEIKPDTIEEKVSETTETDMVEDSSNDATPIPQPKEAVEVTEEKKKEPKEVKKDTVKMKKQKSVEKSTIKKTEQPRKSTDSTTNSEDETFTDVIVNKGKDEDDTELLDGVIYKFEE